MIDTNLCYSKFNLQSDVISEYFYQNCHTMQYQPLLGWRASPIPDEVFMQEPLLKMINDEFEILRAGIIRMEPNRCYKWHVDMFRGVTINMLLTPERKSHCYFGNCKDEYQEQFDFIELQYTKDDFYLFNTEVVHTVINYDLPRYLFTTEFVKHKNELKYNDIRQWSIDKGLI